MPCSLPYEIGHYDHYNVFDIGWTQNLKLDLGAFRLLWREILWLAAALFYLTIFAIFDVDDSKRPAFVSARYRAADRLLI
jgi:hypothetical protein